MNAKPKLLRLAVAFAIATQCQSFQATQPLGTNILSRGIDRKLNDNSFHHLSKPTEASTRLEAAAASSLLAAAGSPAGAFLVLTSIVLVHECGHYLAARNYGIKVDEFAIGFGPKLFGFEALGNEFNFRAFPLGGYVRFPENYNTTLVLEQQKQLREEMKEWKKLTKEEQDDDETESIGYQLANALTLGAIEKKREQEREEELLKQQQQQVSQPWWKSVFGGTTKEPEKPKIPPKPMDPDDVEIEYYDDPDLLQNRPWPERAVVLSGGVVFNLLLAFAIYFGEISTIGLPQPIFDQGIVVSQNPVKEGAANGILRKGDIVVGVNGKLMDG